MENRASSIAGLISTVQYRFLVVWASCVRCTELLNESKGLGADLPEYILLFILGDRVTQLSNRVVECVVVNILCAGICNFYHDASKDYS